MAESTKQNSTPQANGQASWVRAVDEELINAHLGTASAGESYETARRKLGELIEWNIKVATDPAVNGGFELTPVDQSAWLRGAEELCRVYFEIAAEAIGEDEVRARRDSRVADLPSPRVRATLAKANAARWSEFCRQVEAGEFPAALLQDAQQMGSGVLEQHIDEDRIADTARTALRSASGPQTTSPETFQSRVAPWMQECFGAAIASDVRERGDRLLEEVLELLQSHGYDSARVATLRDYVFGRPVGEPQQEAGGVMVTLGAYCLATGLDMHAAGEVELARISDPEVVKKIRAKQESKRGLHTPLPVPPADAASAGSSTDT